MMKPFKEKFPQFIFILLSFFFCLGLFAGRVLQLEKREVSSFPKNGLVIAVYDGDTIKVRFENGLEKKVRFIGVNAPEIGSSSEKGRFQAYMAKRFSFYYLYMEDIKLSYDWELEDKYGRLLAYIWTENEGLFNTFILKKGFASVFLKYPFRKDYRKKFIESENSAKRLEKGLWKKGDYPSISACETKCCLGRIISVRFKCTRLKAQGKFVFLHSCGGKFSTLVPRENLHLFPELKSFEKQLLSVTGFLEEYKGRPQIVAFFPNQIKIER